MLFISTVWNIEYLILYCLNLHNGDFLIWSRFLKNNASMVKILLKSIHYLMNKILLLLTDNASVITDKNIITHKKFLRYQKTQREQKKKYWKFYYNTFIIVKIMNKYLSANFYCIKRFAILVSYMKKNLVWHLYNFLLPRVKLIHWYTHYTYYNHNW